MYLTPYWIRHFEFWGSDFRFVISDFKNSRVTFLSEFEQNCQSFTKKACPWPPYWIRHFEFLNSDFRFVISDSKILFWEWNVEKLFDVSTKLLLRVSQKQVTYRENFMAIFTTLSVVIWVSTGTLGILATLVYAFTMRVVIYDILCMAKIPTLSTSILFCNFCYIVLWILLRSVVKIAIRI